MLAYLRLGTAREGWRRDVARLHAGNGQRSQVFVAVFTMTTIACSRNREQLGAADRWRWSDKLALVGAMAREGNGRMETSHGHNGSSRSRDRGVGWVGYRITGLSHIVRLARYTLDHASAGPRNAVQGSAWLGCLGGRHPVPWTPPARLQVRALAWLAPLWDRHGAAGLALAS
jgi:hypothetical protein